MYEPLFEQIKSVPIILFFITVATLFAGERNLQQRAVYHLFGRAIYDKCILSA